MEGTEQFSEGIFTQVLIQSWSIQQKKKKSYVLSMN